jgi:hypothetical protein
MLYCHHDHLYADDMQGYFPARPADIASVVTQTDSNAADIFRW